MVGRSGQDLLDEIRKSQDVVKLRWDLNAEEIQGLAHVAIELSTKGRTNAMSTKNAHVARCAVYRRHVC